MILGVAGLDARVLFFTLVTTAATTIIFALVPAVGAAGLELSTALKEDDRGGGRSKRALAGLVVTEVALAVLLLVGAGVLIESFARVQSLRTGFVPDGVLTFWLRPSNSRYKPADGPMIIERLLTRIQQVPGVDSAAVNRCTPFVGCARSVVFFVGRPADPLNAPPVGRHYISADYFRTLGIPLVAGRTLTDADRTDSLPVTVISQTTAQVLAQRRSARQAGVVRHRPASPAPRAPRRRRHRRRREYEGSTCGDWSGAGGIPAGVLRRICSSRIPTRGDGEEPRAAGLAAAGVARGGASVEPSLRCRGLTLDDRVDGVLARPRFSAALLASFAGVALFLAAIGVYGLLSYSVSSRLRELGVRLALGAAPARVVSLIVGDGLRLASVGIAIGIAAAVGAERLLRTLIPAVTAANAPLFVAVAAVMAAVAALAAFVPARRAAAVDPIEVLRSE